MPRALGFWVRGRPYLTVLVHIPRFDATGYINFLTDTGADVTTIHWEDRATLIGSAPDVDAALTEQTALRGIAGTPVRYGVTDAEIGLPDAGADDDRFPARVRIALRPAVRGVPALLGRDVLLSGRFCISDDEITFDW